VLIDTSQVVWLAPRQMPRVTGLELSQMLLHDPLPTRVAAQRVLLLYRVVHLVHPRRHLIPVEITALGHPPELLKIRVRLRAEVWHLRWGPEVRHGGRQTCLTPFTRQLKLEHVFQRRERLVIFGALPRTPRASRHEYAAGQAEEIQGKIGYPVLARPHG